MVAGTKARVGRPVCQDVQGLWRKVDHCQRPLALGSGWEPGQHLELQKQWKRTVRGPQGFSSLAVTLGCPALPRDQKVLPDGYQQGKDSPEGGLVLGKAEGTLLTGASLSRRTEAADGLVPGCLARADKIPQASEPMEEERDLEGSCWEDTMLWYPVPPGCVGGMEELRWLQLGTYFIVTAL